MSGSSPSSSTDRSPSYPAASSDAPPPRFSGYPTSSMLHQFASPPASPPTSPPKSPSFSSSVPPFDPACPAFGLRAALLRSDSGLRAKLIRANPCIFADRYSVPEEAPIGEGNFGQVNRCVDNLTKMDRAVKRIAIPKDRSKQSKLSREVNALVALDHPHIVRLIEYFVEDNEVLLVMELLEGPSLGQRMREWGRFTEEFAARSMRHMLKALFCCHCLGIAHNDVSAENFRFQTPHPGSTLRMVDLGFSSFTKNPCGDHSEEEEEEDRTNVRERDIWAAGTLLYAMLSGSDLFPISPSGVRKLTCETDANYVPARLRSLVVAEAAHDLLEGMLEPIAAARLTAREALMHSFITKFYQSKSNGQAEPCYRDKASLSLAPFVQALRSFHVSVLLKRLALLIAAHLLTNNTETLAAVHWLFRFLVRDGQRVEENIMRDRMLECHIEVPEDLSMIFRSADITGKGGLDYVEFVAVAIINEPKLFCRELMLKAIFRFLDPEEKGTISCSTVQSLFHLAGSSSDGMPGVVREACGAEEMGFTDFRAMMVPECWDEQSLSSTAAPWSEAPDVSASAAELPPPALSLPGKNPVKSKSSEAYAIRQMPGFHTAALYRFYSVQPVSNVVLGIVRGTSGYARRALELGLAKIVEVGGDHCGAFFFMPNPKYHWTPDDAAIDEEPHLRFVAWWIHPDFLCELRAWVNEGSGRGSSSDAELTTPGASCASGEIAGVGAPGDFSFSTVGKPTGYLHTYRDLAGSVHLEMLEALVVRVRSFCEQLLGNAFPSARLSAGFHYPVRAQYSTLHLQLRVNSGDVCGGKEGRGVDLFQLLAQFRSDPEAFRRDDVTLHYRATSNLRHTVRTAANAAGRPVAEVGACSLILK